MIPNPWYQGTQIFNLQMGQQLQRNLDSNADELLLRVTEMMKNQFGLKQKRADLFVQISVSRVV